MNKFQLSYAIEDTELNVYEKSLLKLFIKMADSEYKCFPSVSTITRAISMCETTYKKTINSLIDMGLVRRQFRYSKENGQQRSNYFFLSKQLITGTKNSVITYINRAKDASNIRKKSAQVELPLTACKAAQVDFNSDIIYKNNPLKTTSNSNANNNNSHFKGQINSAAQTIKRFVHPLIKLFFHSGRGRDATT